MVRKVYPGNEKVKHVATDFGGAVEFSGMTAQVATMAKTYVIS